MTKTAPNDGSHRLQQSVLVALVDGALSMKPVTARA